MPNALAVAVDLVVFTIREGALHALLVRRGVPPFQGEWALPGGFVRDETLDAAARRELEEETGLRNVYLEQLYTFGDPGRDPRGRVISVAYFALIRPEPVRGSTDAAEAAWFPADKPPRLAFDHAAVLDAGFRRLRAKVGYTTLGSQLLPEEFTLTQLQSLYETLLRRPLDKRNFRRRVLSLGLIRAVRGKTSRGAHRPAQLYAFRSGPVQVLEDSIL
jgi:8-oxo-dGTP diphosphatase